MFKSAILKAFSIIILSILTIGVSVAQVESSNVERANLHINFQPFKGEVITQNLLQEEVQNFNVSSYIAEHRDHGIVRIFL